MYADDAWRSRLPPLVVTWVEEVLLPEVQRLRDSYPALSLREQWQQVDPAVERALHRYTSAYPDAFRSILIE